MSPHGPSTAGHSRQPLDRPDEFDIAMQVLMQHEGRPPQPFRERLAERLPALSMQARDVLLKRCRAAIQHGVALGLRVQLRVLTRREAALALYDRFPGLTRQTSDRIIGESMSRLAGALPGSAAHG